MYGIVAHDVGSECRKSKKRGPDGDGAADSEPGGAGTAPGYEPKT